MTAPRLGLRANLGQFSLLVVVNAFVGAMVGMERTILPPIAEAEFHLAAKSAVLTFIVVFGVTKALTNYLAGRLADRVGRKQVLVAGWLVATPVPFLLMWAPSWTWVLIANALLGVSQGLTWSTTVIMKIDIAGPAKRGLAMGLNEFAGYFAVAGSALAFISRTSSSASASPTSRRVPRRRVRRVPRAPSSKRACAWPPPTRPRSSRCAPGWPMWRPSWPPPALTPRRLPPPRRRLPRRPLLLPPPARSSGPRASGPSRCSPWSRATTWST